MGFRLVIGEVLDVPVKLSVSGAGKPASFAFTLQAKRIGLAEYRDQLGPDAGTLTREFLLENVSGWKGQRLVVDDDTGEPAQFGAEAFEAMLDVVGAEAVIFAAYLKALAASDTAAGKEKN